MRLSSNDHIHKQESGYFGQIPIKNKPPVAVTVGADPTYAYYIISTCSKFTCCLTAPYMLPWQLCSSSVLYTSSRTLSTNVYTVVNELVKDYHALLNRTSAPNLQGSTDPHWEETDSLNVISDSYACKWKLASVED